MRPRQPGTGAAIEVWCEACHDPESGESGAFVGECPAVLDALDLARAHQERARHSRVGLWARDGKGNRSLVATAKEGKAKAEKKRVVQEKLKGVA